MIPRVGLLIASLAAAFVLATALAVSGFAPAGPAPAAQVEPVVPARATEPPVQVDTVYLAPQAEPATVVVQQPVQSGEGEGDEHESEGADD